jgi:hypothetical protein
MRKAKWLVLGVVPAVAMGCFSSSNPGPSDSGETDAVFDTTSPELDSSAPEVAVEAAAPEGAVPEAAPDQYVAEAASGDAGDAGVEAGAVPTVSVLVRNALGVEPGVTVVFQDASGQPVGSVVTDALGVAASPVDALGSDGASVTVGEVTVVLGSPTEPQLVTIQAVEANDQLGVYDSALDPQSTAVPLAFAADAGPPPGTAATQVFAGGCRGNVPGFLYLSGGCTFQGQFPVLVLAIAGEDGGSADFAYTFTKNNTVPADGGTLVLPGPWYPTDTAFAFDVLNSSLGPSPEESGTSVSLSEVAGGVSYTTVRVAGTFPNFTYATHPVYDEALQGEVDYESDEYSGTGQAVSATATRVSPDAGAASVDVSQVLPYVTSLGIDSTTPAQPTVSWSTASPLGTIDGFVAQIAWSGTNDAGVAVNGSWTVVSPPSAASATLPALPSEVSAWAPSSAAVFSQSPVVVGLDATFLTGGYTQLRAQASTLPITSNLIEDDDPFAPALPANGTLQLTGITGPGS